MGQAVRIPHAGVAVASAPSWVRKGSACREPEAGASSSQRGTGSTLAKFHLHVASCMSGPEGALWQLQGTKASIQTLVGCSAHAPAPSDLAP